jgi:uncharacterized membrane protein
MSIRSTHGHSFDTSRVLPVALALMFAVFGNYMGKVRQNFFIGIRTPWTLSSERVWTRTHRLAGRLFVVVGAATLLVALVAPTAATAVVGFGVISAAVIAFVYSSFAFKQEQAAVHS